jgi:hypothetical protein
VSRGRLHVSLKVDEVGPLGGMERVRLGRAAACQPWLYIVVIWISALSALIWMVVEAAPSAAYGVLALLIVIGVCAGLGHPVPPARPQWCSRMRRRLRRKPR